MQLKIILEGEVQGVFFRAFIKEMAKKLNLKGYVKNIENNVEIHAKGEKENIDKLIASCKIGPNGAKVNNIKVILENETNLKDFTIEQYSLLFRKPRIIFARRNKRKIKQKLRKNFTRKNHNKSKVRRIKTTSNANYNL